MKQIKNIVLVTETGDPRHDVSPDVLSIEHRKMQMEGEALPADAGEIMDVVYLLKRMIDLQKYESRTEQKAADKIYERIKDKDGFVFLEDAEYNRLKVMLEKFTVYLQGRFYTPLHDAFDEAITPEQDAS